MLRFWPGTGQLLIVFYQAYNTVPDFVRVVYTVCGTVSIRESYQIFRSHARRRQTTSQPHLDFCPSSHELIYYRPYLVTELALQAPGSVCYLADEFSVNVTNAF